MKHQQGIPCEQLQMLSFDSMISPENLVRFIDSFVDHLDLSKLNFQVQMQKAEGRPSFESKVFLKIYLYGYLNGFRSSRRLATECERNIELHWLLQSLTPNYHSISDFRKNNPDALRNTFKLFVRFLKDKQIVGLMKFSRPKLKFNYQQLEIDLKKAQKSLNFLFLRFMMLYRFSHY